MNRKLASVIIVGIVAAGMVIGITLVTLNQDPPRLRLATTTSTENSGLLDYMLEDFEARYNIEVDVVAVGTGAAIELGKNGDADLILVHARDLELDFVNQGYGYRRAVFMYNDFLLVGPTADPCVIGTGAPNNITAAFDIAAINCDGTNPFYSRGDNSGTNVKELTIWGQTSHGTPDSGGADSSWYFETGAGMGTTLTIADQNDGYTLTDRGTWYSMEDDLTALSVITENDSSGILLNPYSFILVNKELYPTVKEDLAEKLVSFFLCDYGQAKINNFLVNGNVLFTSCYGYNGSIVELHTGLADQTIWNATIGELGMDTLS